MGGRGDRVNESYCEYHALNICDGSLPAIAFVGRVTSVTSLTGAKTLRSQRMIPRGIKVHLYFAHRNRGFIGARGVHCVNRSIVGRELGIRLLWNIHE